MFNSVDRINQQIQELQRMRDNFQQVPAPQPITNVINTQSNTIDFEARYLEENEKVEDILISRKTAFIDLKNKYLKIKEPNGKITAYELILPKDEKDIKIEELEEKINELTEYIKSNAEGKPTSNDTKPSKK